MHPEQQFPPDDFGPLPTIHERHVPTAQAKSELCSFLLEWRQRHQLTAAEYVMLVSGELHADAQFLVRAERKGDGE